MRLTALDGAIRALNGPSNSFKANKIAPLCNWM